MPIIKVREKYLTDSAPKTKREIKTIKSAKEVAKERPTVCRRLSPTTSSKGRRLEYFFRFSRTRSNTTIVSWMEKLKIVSKAVTNKTSTSTFLKYPKAEKIPAGIKTS